MRVSERRNRLLALARGHILEVGVGTGVNLPHYTNGSTLTGVELSPAMLELARQRAQRLGIEVDLRLGDAAALDFADRQFDTVVATHFLSVVADEQRVVSEIGRVLKPGGRLLVIDHVQSHIVLIRFMQQALDPIAARYAGWHMGRDIVGLLTSHGFLIDERHRSRLGMLDEIVSRRAGEAAVYASPSQVAWLSTAGADDVERPRSPQ